MSVLISFLSQKTENCIENHSKYCDKYKYNHVLIDASSINAPQHYAIFKFQTILHYLRSVSDGDLVAILTEDVVLLNRHPIEAAVNGLSIYIPDVAPAEAGPQCAFQIWRRTPEALNAIGSIVEQLHVTGPIADEASALSPFRSTLPNAQGDVVGPRFCSPRYDPNWKNDKGVLCLVFGEMEIYCGVTPVFRDTMFDHLNEYNRGLKSLFEIDDYQGPNDDEPLSVYNPGQDIAIVMFFDKGARSYGRIAEHAAVRYCALHGYTLYVYHQAPDELLHVTGTWIKTFLLGRHLSAHDFVLWVDADVLILDKTKPLGPVLEGRDIAVANDIGPWLINAGILGFRRTDSNREIIARLGQLIEAVPDRSTTYSSGGDQTVIANFLKDLGWSTSLNVDILSMNTPWFFRQPASFMVHYFGIWTEYRILMMDRDYRRAWSGQP